MLFAPGVTLPLMSVSGMPVGVQSMGQPHDDARITALVRLLGDVLPGSWRRGRQGSTQGWGARGRKRGWHD